ncbi:Dabb family protein [Hydrogenimonas thermophila]|uniref:Dabb family protein n=1 Tax=Hydrogenimonas thermophila TaxID=223786 RepID=UPI002937165F|nr:Dabb family protein [Hydrogenimonas thermophila]WOE69554.1 Dabb family protein [Hydrogenimonas thermophila]WOE72068.1 Dabb family protein [Hydrogenimonas thermophila]
MVVHIVMFRFKDENKADNIEKVKLMLEALPQKIESLKSMEVGVNFLHSERSMDLVLTSTFDDKDGLEAYRVHPAHQEVVSFIKEVTIESRVVDYEKGV